MFSLKGRRDCFRLLLPDEFIPEEINEKYTKILIDRHSFYNRPIDFVNESIQKVQVLGFNSGTFQQQQPVNGYPIYGVQENIQDPNKPLDKYKIPYTNRIEQNRFAHPASEFTYRSQTNVLNLIDKTLNIDFRHSLGFLNYFIIFEAFFYQYCRDRRYQELPQQFNVDILNEKGSIYSRIVLDKPLLDGMDMLDLDFSQPVAQSSTFRVIWKYSNIDLQFLDIEKEETHNI